MGKCIVCRTYIPDRRGACKKCFLLVVEDFYGSGDPIPVVAQRHKVGTVTLWRWRNKAKKAGLVSIQVESEGMRRSWSNPQIAIKLLRNRRDRKMSKSEELLGNLLASVISKEWKYTGMGEHPVGSKQPDFWDGRRGLIELFGELWHRNENPQEKVDYYKERGYTCLVVWEKELKDLDTLVEKLRNFTETLGSFPLILNNRDNSQYAHGNDSLSQRSSFGKSRGPAPQLTLPGFESSD